MFVCVCVCVRVYVRVCNHCVLYLELWGRCSPCTGGGEGLSRLPYQYLNT